MSCASDSISRVQIVLEIMNNIKKKNVNVGIGVSVGISKNCLYIQTKKLQSFIYIKRFRNQNLCMSLKL